LTASSRAAGRFSHELGLAAAVVLGRSDGREAYDPPEHGMPEPVLNAFDGLPGVALVPMPVEGFGH
jgi:hypothetical protein